MIIEHPNGYLLGIDFSRYQGEIDFDMLRENGISFGFFKATEHASYSDPLFFRNSARAAHNHIWAGAYHFFRPGVNALAQAEHFARIAEDATSLRPVIDFETFGGLSPVEAAREALKFIEHTEVAWRSSCIFYTNPSSIAMIGARNGGSTLLDAIKQRTDLWISHYQNDPLAEPMMIPPFEDWMLYQFDGDGGIELPDGTDSDFNWFKGDRFEFVRRVVRDDASTLQGKE